MPPCAFSHDPAVCRLCRELPGQGCPLERRESLWHAAGVGLVLVGLGGILGVLLALLAS